MPNNDDLYGKLEDLLSKKIDIFEQIYNLTQEQANVIPKASKSPDVEESILSAFNDYIDKKEKLIMHLEPVDIELDKLLGENEQKLKYDMESHRPNLEVISTQVSILNQLSDKLKALELRNRKELSEFLTSQKKSIQYFKSTKAVASKYTQNMPDYHQSDMSYFLDQKK